MQFELLCTATLVARARCRVRGLTHEGGDLLPAHPAFLGLRRLHFGFEESPAPGAGADSAAAWLDELRDDGLADVWLDPLGRPVIRVRLEGGTQAWEVLRLDAQTTLLGRWEPALPLEQPDLAALADELCASLAGPAGRVRDPILDACPATARRILASGDDGQEASDTAWPHFILPQEADPASRRLLAAAATVLPDAGLAAPPAEALDPKLESLALRGLAAAVNAA
jgi:hypothetical protein